MQKAANATLAVLDGHKYANLATLRKNGQAVITPVWFALVGDKVYVMTERSSGKAKRLRNNPAAHLAPSDRRGQALGPQVAVMGRQLAGAESAQANQALNAKYGLVKRLFDLMFKLRGAKIQQVFLEFRAGT